jgi:hypothetical protein
MNLRRLVQETVILGCFLAASLYAVEHFLRGKTLPSGEVARKWGNDTLDLEKFRGGDQKTRSRMAYSLLQKEKEFKGKSVAEIRKLFGEPDGFYFTDVFPAYLIQVAQTQKEEAWQIVFLLNEERIVQKIIVHKNCCD